MRRLIWKTVILGAVGLAASGCGVSMPTLSLSLEPSGRKLSESFTRAYATRNEGGDDEIVLIRDPLQQADTGAPGAPLNPSPVPLEQVLTIRLLYRPMSGARGDSPASSNAALHWYVLGNPDAGFNGLLQYEGTGFVSIVAGRKDEQVLLRGATLSLVQKQGDLIDPLHTFTLNGDFTAVADDAAAQAVLANIEAAEHPPAAPTPNATPSTEPSIGDLRTTFPASAPIP